MVLILISCNLYHRVSRKDDYGVWIFFRKTVKMGKFRIALSCRHQRIPWIYVACELRKLSSMLTWPSMQAVLIQFSSSYMEWAQEFWRSLCLNYYEATPGLPNLNRIVPWIMGVQLHTSSKYSLVGLQYCLISCLQEIYAVCHIFYCHDMWTCLLLNMHDQLQSSSYPLDMCQV